MAWVARLAMSLAGAALAGWALAADAHWVERHVLASQMQSRAATQHAQG